MANIWPRQCRQCEELYFGGARSIYCPICGYKRKQASRKKSKERQRLVKRSAENGELK